MKIFVLSNLRGFTISISCVTHASSQNVKHLHDVVAFLLFFFFSFYVCAFVCVLASLPNGAMRRSVIFVCGIGLYSLVF